MSNNRRPPPTAQPYFDPIWACTNCFENDGIVVNAAFASKDHQQPSNGPWGAGITTQRICKRCKTSWKPIQVSPSIVEGRWLAIRPVRTGSLRRGYAPRFNLWDPERGMYRLSNDVYPQSLPELVRWCRDIAYTLQLDRFQKGDFRLEFETHRWFDRSMSPQQITSFAQGKKFLQSPAWEKILDAYIKDQLNHPRNNVLLSQFMPEAPRAFASYMPDTPQTLKSQVQELYRCSDSHDTVWSLDSTNHGVDINMLFASPEHPNQSGTPESSKNDQYRGLSIDGSVQKGLTFGQMATWTIELTNNSKLVRHIYGITLVDLPVGNYHVHNWQKPKQEPGEYLTVQNSSGEKVMVQLRHKDMGKSGIAVINTARLTSPTGDQQFMHLKSQSVRDAPGNIKSSAVPNGMTQLLFHLDLLPGAKLGVQIRTPAVLDTHMRKLALVMMKLPEQVDSNVTDETPHVTDLGPEKCPPAFRLPKPHRLKVQQSHSNHWPAAAPLHLSNCVGIMLQALTTSEPDLFRLNKQDIDNNVHPLLVDAIRELKIVPPAADGTPMGGNACTAGDCSSADMIAVNRYGAGQEALRNKDYWEGGDIKRVFWLVPPAKQEDYMFPLPFWVPSREAVALSLFRRAHQLLPSEQREAARAYTAKLMKGADGKSGKTILDASSLDAAVSEMLITPFAPNICRNILLPSNYRSRMHNLLVMELAQTMWDLRRFDLIAAKVRRVKSYNIDNRVVYPDPKTIIVALPIFQDQRTQIGEGRPSVQPRDIVRLRPFTANDTKQQKSTDSKNPGPDIYEAEVIVVTPDQITARLPVAAGAQSVFSFDGTVCSVRYLPSPLPDRFMHRAIDAMHVMRLFPTSNKIPPDVWQRERQISRRQLFDKQLDETQFEIVNNILSSGLTRVPTVVVGPYGCGKTRTLQEAVRQLTRPESKARLLVVTHTNSAADMYVSALSKHLAPDQMLRVYAERRKASSVLPHIRKYTYTTKSSDTSMSTSGQPSSNDDVVFGVPPIRKLMSYQVIVTTLITSGALVSAGLAMTKGAAALHTVSNVEPFGIEGVAHDYFSHILMDEAAQASEPEALVALSLAGPNTKIVLVGDHMQLGPETRHPTARRLGLHRSLLERLYALPVYESTRAGQCKLALCHNYRSHPELVRFTSKLFYGEGLVPMSKAVVPAWPAANKSISPEKRFPVAFVCSGRYPATRDPVSCSWENTEEAQKVADILVQLMRPEAQGGAGKHYSGIAVVAPYTRQVNLIRAHLRQLSNKLKQESQKAWREESEAAKRENRPSQVSAFNPPPLEKIRVTHVRDVQGLEFDVLVMSTVRTFHDIMCGEDEAEGVGGSVEAGAGGLLGGKGDAWGTLDSSSNVSKILGSPDDSDDEDEHVSRALRRKQRAKAKQNSKQEPPKATSSKPRFTDTRFNSHVEDLADSESDDEEGGGDLRDSESMISRRKKNPSIGLFRNTRLFNTAITRAKAMVIGVGDPVLLYYDRCWRSMIRASHRHHTMSDMPDVSDPIVLLDDMLALAKFHAGKITKIPEATVQRLSKQRKSLETNNTQSKPEKASTMFDTPVSHSVTSSKKDNEKKQEATSKPSHANVSASTKITPSANPSVSKSQEATTQDVVHETANTSETTDMRQTTSAYEVSSDFNANSAPYNPFYLQQRPEMMYAQMQLQFLRNQVGQMHQYLNNLKMFLTSAYTQMMKLKEMGRHNEAQHLDHQIMQAKQQFQVLSSRFQQQLQSLRELEQQNARWMHSSQGGGNYLNSSTGSNIMGMMNGMQMPMGYGSGMMSTPHAPPNPHNNANSNVPPPPLPGYAPMNDLPRTRQSVMTPSAAVELGTQVLEVSQPSNQQNNVSAMYADTEIDVGSNHLSPAHQPIAAPPPGFESPLHAEHTSADDGTSIPSNVEDHVASALSSQFETSLSTLETQSTFRRILPDSQYTAYMNSRTMEPNWCYTDAHTNETIPGDGWYSASEMRQLLEEGVLASATLTNNAGDLDIAMAITERANGDIMKTPGISLSTAFNEYEAYMSTGTPQQKHELLQILFRDAPAPFRKRISVE